MWSTIPLISAGPGWLWERCAPCATLPRDQDCPDLTCSNCARHPPTTSTSHPPTVPAAIRSSRLEIIIFTMAATALAQVAAGGAPVSPGQGGADAGYIEQGALGRAQ